MHIAFIFTLVLIATSCKKEVFAPKGVEGVEQYDNRTKCVSTTPVVTDKDSTVVDGSGITDPNDDDFVRKPKKVITKVKN